MSTTIKLNDYLKINPNLKLDYLKTKFKPKNSQSEFRQTKNLFKPKESFKGSDKTVTQLPTVTNNTKAIYSKNNSISITSGSDNNLIHLTPSKQNDFKNIAQKLKNSEQAALNLKELITSKFILIKAGKEYQ
jgi:FtsZ-interacting cell division protein YlmF